MNNYYDSHGRLHHKPVTSENPFPSGNGFIYSAYADKAGVELNYDKLSVCYDLCRAPGYFVRSPGYVGSPISLDEIIGMSALKLLKPEHVKDWNFSPYSLPKFSLIKLVKQLWLLRPMISKIRDLSDPKTGGLNLIESKMPMLVFKHRNYFWQNNLDQLYRFAFRVPFDDRAFLLKNWGKFQVFNPLHLFYAAYGKVQSLYKPNGIDWLKYGGKVAEKEMLTEFPADHPIVQKLG